MTMQEVISRPEYSFLQTDDHLGKNILFLTFGGSYAYGTNVTGSDIDIRGVFLPSKREVLTGANIEQVEDKRTDTTIYDVRKAMHLFKRGNPNTIEMLGCRPDHYACVTKAGQRILDSKDLFLSKQIAHSFGGYASAQLRRLTNKIDANVENMGNRNRYAIQHKRIEKHMMHLIRLYMMAYDILLTGEIITYRESDRGLLLSIRNGEYLDENGLPSESFQDLVSAYQDQFEYAERHSILPEYPDDNKIDDLLCEILEAVVVDKK